MHDSQSADSYHSSNTQTQQQAVIPAEQNVDLNALTERDAQLRQLQV
jgi:hypothetical protein